MASRLVAIIIIALILAVAAYFGYNALKAQENLNLEKENVVYFQNYVNALESGSWAVSTGYGFEGVCNVNLNDEKYTCMNANDGNIIDCSNLDSDTRLQGITLDECDENKLDSAILNIENYDENKRNFYASLAFRYANRDIMKAFLNFIEKDYAKGKATLNNHWDRLDALILIQASGSVWSEVSEMIGACNEYDENASGACMSALLGEFRNVSADLSTETRFDNDWNDMCESKIEEISSLAAYEADSEVGIDPEALCKRTRVMLTDVEMGLGDGGNTMENFYKTCIIYTANKIITGTYKPNDISGRVFKNLGSEF